MNNIDLKVIRSKSQ